MDDTVTLTCHTPNCANNGEPVELPWNGEPLDFAVCGACSQPITDVAPDGAVKT